jgi:hypothetical protein
MKTLLSLYCEFAGWQGGTIHQALEDFKGRPRVEQDSFCNKVFKYGTNNLDLSNLKLFNDFTKVRAYP